MISRGVFAVMTTYSFRRTTEPDALHLVAVHLNVPIHSLQEIFHAFHRVLVNVILYHPKECDQAAQLRFELTKLIRRVLQYLDNLILLKISLWS
jgi:hypothetical protein